MNIDSDWISASSTYNYLMKDPLLDWLKYHYNTFIRSNPDFSVNLNIDSRNDFNYYIMKQGVLFEKKIIKYITEKVGKENIVNVNITVDNNHDLNILNIKANETVEMMKKGVPIIYNGVLTNPNNKTFGIPDLIVRSDWIKFLVKNSPISKRLENKSAPLISDSWHYRIIDIKFTSLLLRSDGVHLLNSSSFPAYKSQLLIYNWALGYHQGYTPEQAYILGNKWRYTLRGRRYTSNSYFEKFGVVDYKFCDYKYIEITQKAIQWLKEVKRDEASKWNIIQYPLHRWELYPNMSNKHDFPWSEVKKKIASITKELTSLWMVGPKNRDLALKSGVCQWTDSRCTPEILGIKNKNSKILAKIIEINQKRDEIISPKYIKNNFGYWKRVNTLEFFIDFEFCNQVLISRKLLSRNTVFLIGVGYIEPNTNKWTYHCFIVDRITSCEEIKICKDFYNYIKQVSEDYNVKKPVCIHWSATERIIWNNILKRSRSLLDKWELWSWRWLDLSEIFKQEPVVIHGCMSFGLKEIALAMKRYNLINTTWNKDILNGKSVMLSIKEAYDIVRKTNLSLQQISIIKNIIEYNRIDVRVVYEILSYLRNNHCKIEYNENLNITENKGDRKRKFEFFEQSNKKRKYY